MTIKALKNNDFFVDTGKKGKVLCCTQNKGVMFVFFYLGDGQCQNCETMKPDFMSLVNEMPQIQYAMVDIGKNMEIASKSKQTVAPITYVPYLIVYVNGRPFLRYDGGKSKQEMKNFLKELLANIPKEVIQQSSAAKFDSEVPVYPSGGIPYNVVCDKNSGVCYLSFGEIVNKK